MFQPPTSTTPPAPANMTLPDKEGVPKFAVPTEESAGEKFFNQLTYTGIGYFLNLGVSVVLWDFLMDGRGRAVYKNVSKGLNAGFKAVGIKEGSALAGTITKMSFSPLGGHFTMIPLKISEDHARYITHKANCYLDKNYQYKDLQASWNTPEEYLPPMMDEPTEATWGQTAIRRGIGWATVTAAGTGLAKIGLEKPLENGTLRAFNKGIDLTGNQGLKRLSQKPLVSRYIKLTALDSYFTVITAAVTYMTNNMFGEKHGSHHPAPEEQTLSTPQPTVVLTAPLQRKDAGHEAALHGNHVARIAAEKMENSEPATLSPV